LDEGQGWREESMHFHQWKRREFITLLGGAAAWPVAARAQQAMPVVGYLSARSPDDAGHLAAAFRDGLGKYGYVEGVNVAIEYRWAIGQFDRLQGMARELVQRPVNVLVATGGEPAALAARSATSTIPIVFAIGGDPVKLGLAASYNRPGGNLTGISLLTNTLEAKRVGLLRTLIPTVATVGILVNPNFPPAPGQISDVQEAAQRLGLRVLPLRANTDSEIDVAFDAMVQQRDAALAVAASPFFDTRRDKLVALAARHAIPTMFHFREFVAAGGLISYGIHFADAYQQVGVHTGQILRGAKPGELPVMQPTKFELVINLKTAKTLGLAVPPDLFSIADEVIE
jgi:putative ABC transport system substrate-binding protein